MLAKNCLGKKIIISFTSLLLSSYSSVLLAAADNNTDAYTQQQLQQLQQLAASLPQSAPAVQASVNQVTTVTKNLTALSGQTTDNIPATSALPVTAIPVAALPVTQVPNSVPVTTSTSSEGAANNSALAPVEANSATQQMVSADPALGIREDAFNGMTQNLLPMTPEQIQRLKKMFNASQYAAAAPAGIPPRPTARSQFVNLAPGATPPVIRMSQGLVTSLVFIDSSGAPWPIESYDIGNPASFNIQWNKVDNTLLVQATTLYNYGNLAVRLRGLTTPVMLTLIPGQQAVDYRVDLRVQGLGPNATSVPIGNGLPASANPDLMGVLDGVPPSGSRPLSVSGGECQAWLSGDTLYLRTRLTLLSPSWLASMSSADGMKAYQMQKTPMLLVSLHGKPVQLKIEGF